MVRTLTIDIWGYEWDISSGLHGKQSEIELFGTIEVKDNKIAYMTNYDIFNREIKAAKEYDIFKEHCIFKHVDTVFEGTFIDAFNYIQEKLTEHAKKQGDMRRAV
ncbi:MAG: hypothetical protein LBP54_05385 [Campylobacteraceae bacterium]|jgi:hypothetical protein|nr:hypothetical protein [Campylobacteraceae bacterium]